MIRLTIGDLVPGLLEEPRPKLVIPNQLDFTDLDLEDELEAELLDAMNWPLDG